MHPDFRRAKAFPAPCVDGSRGGEGAATTSVKACRRSMARPTEHPPPIPITQPCSTEQRSRHSWSQRLCWWSRGTSGSSMRRCGSSIRTRPPVALRALSHHVPPRTPLAPALLAANPPVAVEPARRPRPRGPSATQPASGRPRGRTGVRSAWRGPRRCSEARGAAHGRRVHRAHQRIETRDRPPGSRPRHQMQGRSQCGTPPHHQSPHGHGQERHQAEHGSRRAPGSTRSPATSCLAECLAHDRDGSVAT